MASTKVKRTKNGGCEIIFKNNMNIFKAEYNRKKMQMTYALGLKWQSLVTKIITLKVYTGNKPWRLTGRLRASLTFVTPYKVSPRPSVPESKSNDYIKGKAPGTSVIVGSNVKYAAKINRKYKFIEESILNHRKDYENVIKQILKN